MTLVRYPQGHKIRKPRTLKVVEATKAKGPNKIPKIGFYEKIIGKMLINERYLQCEKYIDVRRKYLKKYYWQRPSCFKLVQLLSVRNII